MKTYDVVKMLGNNILIISIQAQTFYDWMVINKITEDDTLDFSDVERMTTAFLMQSYGKFYREFKIEPQVEFTNSVFENKFYHATWVAKNAEMWDKIIEEAQK